MQSRANRRWPASHAGRISKYLFLTVLGATLLLRALPAEAANPNFRLCFRPVINVPGPTSMQPPNPDGIINNDFGWTDGWRYVFGNGTPVSDVIVQAVRTTTDLYMSFEVNNDPSFDEQDVIVLALDPTGAAADQRRLHIFPVFTGTGAAGTGDPREVQYWANSTTWNSTPAGAPPAGTIIKVTSAGVAPNVSYFVEVKLPRAAYAIPAAADFGLYFNVLRTDGVLGTVNEKFWPTNATPIGIFLTNTPPANEWGTANVAGACNGVSVLPSGITTNNIPQYKISLTGPNVFSALVSNNSIDSAGNPVAATQVNATFRIANFGLPAPDSWANVPAPGNPTAPANVPASGNTTFSTGAWTLTPAQQATYNTPTTSHQCILVELDSTAPNTVFVNKSAWTNMLFGTASTFEGVAEIGTVGYAPPPGGRSDQAFDIYVTTRESQQGKQGTGPLGVAARASQAPFSDLVWLAWGVRRTGNFVVILGKKFEITEPVNAYGYVVRHTLTEEEMSKGVEWATEFFGDGLRRVQIPSVKFKPGEGVYQLDVRHGGAKTLRTVVKAGRETIIDTGGPPKSKFAVFLHGGANFPHGDFGNVFDPGFSFNAGLEYAATDYFSLEGIFGYHRFRGQTFGAVSVSDLDLFQFSGNGKFYLAPPGSVRPWVNFGVGAYKFKSGPTRFGGNVGAGLQFNLTQKFALEGAYNFHAVTSFSGFPGSDSRFSTLQGGVRFRF